MKLQKITSKSKNIEVVEMKDFTSKRNQVFKLNEKNITDNPEQRKSKTKKISCNNSGKTDINLLTIYYDLMQDERKNNLCNSKNSPHSDFQSSQEQSDLLSTQGREFPALLEDLQWTDDSINPQNRHKTYMTDEGRLAG